MCDGLSWRRRSALAGRRGVIGEGRRGVRGERAAAKGKDALGGLRSGFLRGRGAPLPVSIPGQAAGLAWERPLFRPELVVQMRRDPAATENRRGVLPRCLPGSAGFGSGFAGISGRFFFLLWARVSSSVVRASTFPGSVRTETACGLSMSLGLLQAVGPSGICTFPAFSCASCLLHTFPQASGETWQQR